MGERHLQILPKAEEEMSLFACEKCNTVENTACTTGSLGWTIKANGEMEKTQRLCSLCHDGKWHGMFPREDASGYIQGKFGLERKK